MPKKKRSPQDDLAHALLILEASKHLPPPGEDPAAEYAFDLLLADPVALEQFVKSGLPFSPAPPAPPVTRRSTKRPTSPITPSPAHLVTPSSSEPVTPL